MLEGCPNRDGVQHWGPSLALLERSSISLPFQLLYSPSSHSLRLVCNADQIKAGQIRLRRVADRIRTITRNVSKKLTQKGGGHSEILEAIHKWPARIGTRSEDSRESILTASTLGRYVVNVVVQVLSVKKKSSAG